KSAENNVTLACCKVRPAATCCGIWWPCEKPPNSELCVETRTENSRRRAYTTLSPTRTNFIVNIFLDKRLGRLIQLCPILMAMAGGRGTKGARGGGAELQHSTLVGVNRRGQNQREEHNPRQGRRGGAKGGT